MGRKSSFSGAQGNCVRVKRVGDTMLRVYESDRLGDRGMIITCSQFQPFMAGLLEGKFVEPADGDLVRISTDLATGEVLTSQANFDVFVKGVHAGEFDDFCNVL